MDNIKKYKSCSEWTKLKNITEDEHFSKAEAQGICNLLMALYSTGDGCLIRGRYINAWIEEV